MNAHDKASTTIVSRGHPGIREIFVKDKNVITVGANISKYGMQNSTGYQKYFQVEESWYM
jgi:ribosomal protein S24E